MAKMIDPDTVNQDGPAKEAVRKATVGLSGKRVSYIDDMGSESSRKDELKEG